MLEVVGEPTQKKRRISGRDLAFGALGAGLLVVGKKVVKMIAVKMAESAYEDEDEDQEASRSRPSAANEG